MVRDKCIDFHVTRSHKTCSIKLTCFAQDVITELMFTYYSIDGVRCHLHIERNQYDFLNISLKV